MGPHYAYVPILEGYHVESSSYTDSFCGLNDRSSKSALHGLIHWLAGAYAKKGITVNGVAPALIGETKMLPGGNEELAKSTYNASALSCLDHSG